MYWWLSSKTGLQAKTDQEAGVKLADKNVAIKDQQDGNKDKGKRGPSPEILSVWWPCCTDWAFAPRKSAAAARMAMGKTHLLIFSIPATLFPTPLVCVYSRPSSPCRSGLMSKAISSGVIKEEIPAKGKLFY